MPELQGKTAIVTGGTKGIGLAVARALLDRGMNVVVSARTASDIERVVGELAEASGAGDAAVRGVVCDVRRAEDCQRLITETVDAYGSIDVLVNNAGIGRFAPLEEFDVDEWRGVIETNLLGAFYCTHAALPHIKAAGGGWIINIASLAAKNAFPGGTAYNASKFGLLGMSEALMQEVRHDDVRVSTILPGSVATSFSHPTPGTADEWKIQPDDIAKIVTDLLDTPARTLPSWIEVRPAKPGR